MATVTIDPAHEYGGRQRRRQAAKRAAAYARLSSVNRRRTPYTSARPHIGLATRTRPAPNLIIPNAQFGLPEAMKMKFRYNGFSDDPTTLAANGVARVTWRLSNPTDPNYTGLGHQPMLWDQFTTLYLNCIVYAAKIQYQIIPLSENGSTAVIGFASRPYEKGVNEVQVYRDEWERPDSVNGIVYSGGDTPSNIYTQYIQNYKLTNLTKKEYLAQRDFWVQIQNTTFNPPREIWNTIIMKNLGSADIKYRLVVTLTYYTYCFGKNHVNPSLGSGPDHGVPDLQPENV